MDFSSLPLLYSSATTTVVTTTLVLVVVYGLYWIGWNNGVVGNYKKKRDQARPRPPEPPGAWPIFGHLAQLGGPKPLFRTLGDMADRNGPVFMLRFGMYPTLVVSRWDVARECFTTNDRALASRPTSVAGKYLSYGGAIIGFAPYGAYWREIRKIATLELLSNRRIESLKHIQFAEVGKCIRELYELWVRKQRRPFTVEMNQWFGDLTMNVIVKMVIGKRYFNTTDPSDEDKEARQFRRAIIEFSKLAGVSVASDAIPFLEWMDLQGHKSAMKKASKEMDSIAVGWLDEHRDRRRGNRNRDDQQQDDDFMDVLLSILEEDTHLSTYDRDTVVKATALALILAASETTAITLSWALSLLLNNRHVLRKVRDELEKCVGKDREVKADDIKNLVYLQAVVKETLRLYPPGPLSVPHEAIEDCCVHGFRVPAGTRVLVNLWKIQRDPTLSSDPSQFRPERFLTVTGAGSTTHINVDVRGQHFELIPFGSGRRICPGISFALHTIHMTLARLIHEFELGTPSQAPVDMTEGSGLTMPRITPLQVIFTPRLPFLQVQYNNTNQ
ncbi:PREDICTED: cytochrome P450 CYP82D47-like [Nelumbo nucifera]|uniref:Cytochrome P450 CYP82D47-like n=2 Tax=Nelumbo nucifera TaxID=4432 RepID=A0A1U7ZMW8_NELNU|nr:PREDICTED: cytochrome P450 CYP82D47-like [Nelumbo nucifera]DAD30354.1 TPA_asm: hypothetical protein HUJ06_009205 [Nelumbo nucifera]